MYVSTYDKILHFSTIPQHASTSFIAHKHKGVTTSDIPVISGYVITWKWKRIYICYVLDYHFLDLKTAEI